MFEDMKEEHKSRFPNIQKLVAAYRVGQINQNTTLCKWLFPCTSKYEDIEVNYLTSNCNRRDVRVIKVSIEGSPQSFGVGGQ
jgi:hypothetical protein